MPSRWPSPTPTPAAERAALRDRRLTAPVLLAAGVLLAAVALHLRDPHRGGSWGYCPWLVLTGTYCPGCGGLRAVNDLTRGDVAAAVSSNLLLVCSVPFVALWWLRSVMDRWRGVQRTLPARHVAWGAVAFGAVCLAFWVARNTGPGTWLAP